MYSNHNIVLIGKPGVTEYIIVTRTRSYQFTSEPNHVSISWASHILTPAKSHLLLQFCNLKFESGFGEVLIVIPLRYQLLTLHVFSYGIFL